MRENGGTAAVLTLARLKVADFVRDTKTGLSASASTASDQVDNDSIEDSSRLVIQLTWADTVDLTQVR